MRKPCVLDVYDSSFDVLLKKGDSLLIEMYKIYSNISPAFICDLMSESEFRYQTRSHFKITENADGVISEEKLMMKIAFLTSYQNFGALCLKMYRN